MTVKFAPLAIPTTHSRALNLHWLRGMLESVVARSALSLRDDEESVSEEAGAAVWQVDNATTEAVLQPGDTVTVRIPSVKDLCVVIPQKSVGLDILRCSEFFSQALFLVSLLELSTITPTFSKNDVQILIASVSALGREGVCGNGICEVGELLPIDSTGAIGQRCADDCPLQVIGCPQNDAGDVCSGVSVPHIPFIPLRSCIGSAV